jgi:uncharacterized protein
MASLIDLDDSLGTASDPLPASPSSPKKFKPSRFNAHTTAPDGTTILYNAYSGHCCALPPAAALPIRSYLSKKGFEGTLDELGQYLFRAGYLVDAELNELMMWDVKYAAEHYRNDRLMLTLLSSEDCNFRCVYCSQPFARGTMLPAVREGIRKYVEARITKLGFLLISWFGGEPLLGYEAIEELAPFLKEITAANDVSYASHITTNGYLLSPDRARSLLKWGVLVFQITVDGLPEDHDRKRPLRDGGPTFHQIMNNLEAMRQFDAPFKVRLRVNFDRDNVDRLDPFFKVVRDRLRGDPRFRIAFNAVGRWGGPNDRGISVLTHEALQHQARLREQARCLGLPLESPMTYAKSGMVICQATLLGGLIVGADGRLMKCTNHGVLPAEINVVGKILSDGSVNIHGSKNLKWILPYYNHDPKCKKCFYLPVCRGGIICPFARVQGIAPECPQERMHIRSLLLEYWHYRQAEDGGKVVRVGAGSRSP